MSATEFVHLHVHSEYSLLDGAIRLKDLVAETAQRPVKAVAVTEHGNLYSAVAFYQEAVKAGVKPILGMESYMTPGLRSDRSAPKNGDRHFHLTLLAENNDGYRNLMKLSSIAYLEGFYYKPRIDWEVLEKHHHGLILLSGCLHGQLPTLLLRGRKDEAYAEAARFRDLVGPDRFFIELMDHGLPEQRQANPLLIALANDLGLPLVATNDSHYLHKGDDRIHEILVCIQTAKKLSDQDRMMFGSGEFYLKTPEEMAALFREVPEAIRNTVAIAERCSVKMKFGENILPHFDVPPGFDTHSYLRHLCQQGLDERFRRNRIDDDDLRRRYREQLEFELNVIIEMGFAAYFLIVWDFLNYARGQGIPVGPGRGSAAGALVSYVLWITDVDPIKYDLVFERFLNPERVSMPDIDIDLCTRGRQQVIQYVVEKYGHDHVSQIVTFGTLAARAVIRDVGRVLDIPLSEVDKVAKLIPQELKITLKKAIEQEAELRKLRDSDQRMNDLLTAAMGLEGLARHASVHAAAVVISREPLTEYVPLSKDPKTGEMNLTQFSMNYIADLGLLKMDFLGLSNLTILHDTAALIKRTHGLDIDIEHVPLDDGPTYHLLSRGDTVGVFQLESSGMREWLKKLRPTVFADVIAMVALYRPGPMDWIPNFIDGKYGKVVKYLHPALEPILAETYGVAVYQEQVMQMAREVAGFTMGEADILRKVISKKKLEDVAKQRIKFVKGAVAKGVPEDKAGEIFTFIEPFAGYGFNKSHATCYALIAYQTAYLKCHYPAEFMAALMTSYKAQSGEVVKLINECRTMGIAILPPDVNQSELDFSVTGGKIRFGMSAVRNVGEGAVEAILVSRTKKPFVSLHDFCRRVDLKLVNRRAIESLIKCGAFDSLNPNRCQLLEGLDKALSSAQQDQIDRERGQLSLFGGAASPAPQPTMDKLPVVEPWNSSQRLAAEREMLGFYVTGHPLLAVKDEIAQYVSCNSQSLAGQSDHQKVRIAGVISAVQRRVTKKKEPMATADVEDLEGFFRAVFYPEAYSSCREALDTTEPLIIIGETKRTETGCEVIASEVWTLADARARYCRQLTVRVPVEAETGQRLARLKRIIEEYPGEVTVVLRLLFPTFSDVGEVKLQAATLRARPCLELSRELEKLVGEDGFSFC